MGIMAGVVPPNHVNKGLQQRILDWKDARRSVWRLRAHHDEGGNHTHRWENDTHNGIHACIQVRADLYTVQQSELPL